MKKIKTFENKKILVLGLAKSGFAAAQVLNKLGAIVTVNDSKPFSENLEAQKLLEEGVKVICGSHPIELLDEDFAMMVKNPGIRYDNPMVVRALEIGIPVITEIEIAYLISEAPIVGITGTNGKTTTTTLIHHILNEGNKPAKLAGNIGFPASEVASNAASNETLVMETSSFQLMGVEQFHPHIAVITNIYSTHLDYHGTQEAYEAAKWNLQKNMTEDDYLILNFNQDKMKVYAKRTKATVVPFSTTEMTDGAYEQGGKLYFKGEYIMESAQLSLPGEHNIENALAAISVAKLNRVDNAAIAKILSSFSGVRHRLQYLGEAHGRRAYNDTEATNILAAKKALTAFDHSKLWLFAGGLDRGNDFDELESSLVGLKGMVLMGETTPKFQVLAEKLAIPYIIAPNVRTGLKEIFPKTEPGDTILLSPACASWDQYKNAEERGDLFIETFEQLKK